MKRVLALMTVATLALAGCRSPAAEAPESTSPQTTVELTGTVQITGKAEVGELLTANAERLTGKGDFSYQWMRETGEITGETGQVYKVTDEDIGSRLLVKVRRSGTVGEVISAPTLPVGNPFSPALTGTVSITGVAKENETLAANTASLGGSGTISHSWLRGETAIVGATGNTYKVQSADVGFKIKLTVSRAGNSGTVTSLPTDVVVADESVPPPPPPPENTSPYLTLTKDLKDAVYMQFDDPAILEVNWSDTGAGDVKFRWFKASSRTGTGTPITDIMENWQKPPKYTPPTDTIGTTYYYVEMYNTSYWPEGLAASTTKSAVAEIKVTERTGGSGIGTPDTEPDAVVNRFQSYLSKADFEALFPLRVGSPGWRDYMQNNGGHAVFPNGEWQKYDEYYSYDNLIAAIRDIARWAYVLETRDVAGGYTRANSKGYLVEKSTGNRYPVFTGENFNGRNETIIKTTVDYGTFLNSKIENDNRRELAGLLANMAHESGGGWDSQPLDEQTKWGFFYNEEVDVVLAGGYSDAYTSHESVDFPPVPGQSYHGRGGIQLSWNYNYGPFSIVAFGDKNVLLQNPGRVAKEGKLGWMSGIWFWMTPDLPKASCHDVIQSTWKPEGIFASAAGKGITWGFGATIIVINGGKESGGGEKPRRVNHYKDLAEKTGANIGGENITTAGMSPWT